MIWLFRRVILSVCALLMAAILALPSDVGAQTLVPSSAETPSAAAALPDPLTPEAVRELVSRLSDQEVRVLLLDRLDAVAQETAEETQGSSGLGLVGPTLLEIGEGVVESVSRGGQLLTGMQRGFARFFEPRGWSGVWTLVGFTVLAIVLGFIAEFIIDRALRAWRGQIVTLQANTLGQTLKLLIKRAFFDTIGLITFYFVTRFALQTFLSAEPPDHDGSVRHYSDALIASTFVSALIVTPRVLLAISRFLSAPFQPELRLIHTDDWTARFLYRQQIII